MLIALQPFIQSSDLFVHQKAGNTGQDLGESDNRAMRAMGDGKSVIYEKIE
ncbi:MAG: hypothetical protein A4E49_01910 [Methanosaeta sp. PtaU1.Bin112]|nr:MAG: hypothetical protein A4E49_01910 [Methanosaeta sp. PtaU1.Bin112]